MFNVTYGSYINSITRPGTVVVRVVSYVQRNLASAMLVLFLYTN